MAPLLEARALAFSYGSREVLDGLDFTVWPGELVGLVGPNGGGKSTLLGLLFGVLRPSRGEVRLCGLPVESLSRREMARCAALVPQDTGLRFAVSVREIVAMGRRPHLGRFRPEGPADLEIVERALAATGTRAFAARPVSELSGGERQRVLVARAIAQETQVLFLDEPTANLDLVHQLETLELVSRYVKRGRCAVAAIHDLSLASRYCDRILLLSGGRIAADGPPQAVVTEENLRRHFHIQARIRVEHDGGGITIFPIAPVG